MRANGEGVGMPAGRWSGCRAWCSAVRAAVRGQAYKRTYRQRSSRTCGLHSRRSPCRGSQRCPSPPNLQRHGQRALFQSVAQGRCAAASPRAATELRRNTDVNRRQHESAWHQPVGGSTLTSKLDSDSVRPYCEGGMVAEERVPVLLGLVVRFWVDIKVYGLSSSNYECHSCAPRHHCPR